MAGTVNLNKVQGLESSVKFLGVSGQVRQKLFKLLDKTQDYLMLERVKQLQMLFIPQLEQMLCPLYKLVKKRTI